MYIPSICTMTRLRPLEDVHSLNLYQSINLIFLTISPLGRLLRIKCLLTNRAVLMLPSSQLYNISLETSSNGISKCRGHFSSNRRLTAFLSLYFCFRQLNFLTISSISHKCKKKVFVMFEYFSFFSKVGIKDIFSLVRQD